MEQQQRERTRRAYAKKGERSQVMVSFRLDNELAAWLAQQPNKGRYINELIAADKRRKEVQP